MMQTYVNRRREPSLPAPEKRQHSTPVLPVNGILPAETLGRQVDLPEAIRGKMEASFGADLSQVTLYESQAVADAGADAMTMGSKIGFAPGKLDFASSGGQALLGHELSHVVSQARGEVTGSGFLNDSALEARADREGAMAAAGESVYPVTPVSASSPVAGPMQAKKKSKEEKQAAKDAAELEHIQESFRTNIALHTSEEEKAALEQQVRSHFTGPDRKKWQQKYLTQKIADAKALNQTVSEQGLENAYMSEQYGKFSSSVEFLRNVAFAGDVFDDEGRTSGEGSKSLIEMMEMELAVTGEDKDALHQAVEMVNQQNQNLSKEQIGEFVDRERERALPKRAERLKRKKKDRW